MRPEDWGRPIDATVRKIYKETLARVRSHHPANAHCFEDESFFEWLNRAQGKDRNGSWHGGLGIPDVGILKPHQTLWRFTTAAGDLSNWFISRVAMDRIKMQAMTIAAAAPRGRRLQAVQVVVRELLQLPPDGPDPTFVIGCQSLEKLGVIIGGGLNWDHDNPTSQNIIRFLQNMSQRGLEHSKETQIYVPEDRELLKKYFMPYMKMQPISDWAES